MTFRVEKIISDGIPYFFIDLKDTGTFQYNVIQNKGSSIERVFTKGKINKFWGSQHLIEHMSFKSTKNYTTQDITKLLKENGQHNAMTGFDNVTYFIKSIADNMDNAIKLVNDIAFNDMTKITEQELETEKDIVISEAKLLYDNPQDMFHYYSSSKAYGINDFDNIIGDPKTLKEITLKDLATIKGYLLYKDNLTFKIAYDSSIIEPQKIIEKIETSMKEYDIGESNKIINHSYNSKLPFLINTSIDNHLIVDKLKDYPQQLISTYLTGIKDNILVTDWVLDYMSYYSDTSLFEYVREKAGLCYSIGFYSGKEFNTDTYRLVTEISKDKIESYNEQLNSSLQDSFNKFNKDKFLTYFNIHKMNDKLKLLNLNSAIYLVDKFIDNPNIFSKYEDLLKTKGILEFTDVFQKNNLTFDTMSQIMEVVTNNFKNNKNILLITN